MKIILFLAGLFVALTLLKIYTTKLDEENEQARKGILRKKGVPKIPFRDHEIGSKGGVEGSTSEQKKYDLLKDSLSITRGVANASETNVKLNRIF